MPEEQVFSDVKRTLLQLRLERERTRQVARQRIRPAPRTIARFQHLAFRLAALHARIEGARLLAQDLARETTAEAVQLHGAFGMTEQAEAQRFFRPARVGRCGGRTPRPPPRQPQRPGGAGDASGPGPEAWRGRPMTPHASPPGSTER